MQEYCGCVYSLRDIKYILQKQREKKKIGLNYYSNKKPTKDK